MIPLFKVFSSEEAHAMLKPVLESGRLASGPQVAKFETQLAAWFGVPDVVAVNDSSGALMLALYLAGVRPGDEVIVSSLACAATLMPIANLFARPVWCDIDPATGMPTASSIAPLITERTRAILVYHWSGDVAELAPIMTLAKQHDLKVVEEASEAFGATYDQKRLGGQADFCVYSFYATKHINTGEGAAILAADQKHIPALRHLRRFGLDPTTLRLPNGDLNPQFDIPLAGFNLQMGEIAATIGIAALSHADHIVEMHQSNGRYYDSALEGVAGITQLQRSARSVSAYWTFSVLAERRDDLIRKLISHGIGAQRLHLRHDVYSCFDGKHNDLPGVAHVDACNISIPCGWWVGEEERSAVAACIRSGW